MKRARYILMALTAFMIAACSGQIPDAPSQTRPEGDASYIFFEAGILDVAQTKVDLINQLPSEDGTAFGVVGYYDDGQEIFDDYSTGIANVYKEDGIFKYDHLAPWMGTLHTFHAFYPHSLNTDLEIGEDGIPSIYYMQPTSTRNMSDILGAYVQVTGEDVTRPVEIEFQHLLWAFNIEINNSQTYEATAGEPITNPTLTIRKVDISLSNCPFTAYLKLDFQYTVQTSSRTELTYNLYTSETGEQITTGQYRTYGPLMFVPASDYKYQVTIEYTTATGVRGKMTYPAEGEYKTISKALERGKAYTLVIKKTNDKFFEVEELRPEDWTPNEFEHTFQ